MRIWTTMAIVPLMLASATGCSGKDMGPATTKAYALDGFTGVEVAGPYDVTIRHGDAFSIEAKGPQAELDQIKIERDGSTLSVGRKQSSWSFGDHNEVSIAITMPKVEKLKLAGSGSINADSVEGDAADAVVTGSGELKIARLIATRADLTVSGSGGIEVAGGKIASGGVGVTGSGDVEAGGLVADALDVSVTGSGNVEAQATRTANVRVVGSGDVEIGGGAKCSTSKTGSGDISCG